MFQMLRPYRKDVFVFSTNHVDPKWNCDTSGELASNNPSFNSLEIYHLLYALDEWAELVHGKGTVLTRRTLRVPLIPNSDHRSLESPMIAYYVKCLAQGQRPCQEFKLLQNYLIEFQLRAILVMKQFPKPTWRRTARFDFDSKKQVDGQDQEIGPGRIWDPDELSEE